MVNQIMHLGGGNGQQSKSFSAVLSVLARLQLNSFIAAFRMEETSQQESKQELVNQIEEEGGIRRRLRDRDLLRKRKAEAEEKETNQVESQRKRSRAENKSGAKKRGRPRKAEPAELLPAVQEEVAGTQEDPAVVVVPEPAAVISDQISQYPAALQVVESQPAPAPVFESVQSSFYFKPAVDPAPVPAYAPDAVSAPSQDSISAMAPPQVETLYMEPQDRETLDQVLIEDLGPDEEEEDTSSSQNTRADEGLNETLLINVPEQNRMFSVPTLSSPPVPQEYLPGN